MNITKVNIDHYNNTGRSYPLFLKSTATQDILNSPDNYNVVVEKLEVPVNGKSMPINNDSTPYNIAIYNDSKVIPLPYGINFFSFSGPFYSVQNFLDKVNNIVQKELSPYTTFGQFILNKENMIEYVRNTEFDQDFSNFTFYFDERLTNLLTFDYNYNDYINFGDEKLVKLDIVKGPATAPYSIVKVEQKSKTFNLFYTLKSIRVYSDLPTNQFLIFDMAEKTLVYSNLLTEIIFNSMENYDISNLLYIPSVFRENSLYSSVGIRNLNFFFTYKYADGSELPIIIEPFQYSSITLSFNPAMMK